MEQINRIEIQGHVGNVNIVKIGDSLVAHFTVATNYAYHDREGLPVIETTWHTVTAWQGKDIPDLSFIQKGAGINVKGRIKHQKYIAADKTERVSTEIIASSVKPVENS